jgi:tRNA modification GTPase
MASILTPRGRAAVAMVSVRCESNLLDLEQPLFRAANGRALAAQPLNRVCFGRWGSEPGEDVVVCRVAPDVTEISCHGGVAPVARIMRDLESRGLHAITWTKSLRDSNSLITAECLEALTGATTYRTAAILLEQSSGLLEQAISALLEAPIGALVAQIDQLLQWAEFGRHLTEPWRVVLTGLPNVGKSSLINRLLGYERSIVYAEPGTTRDVVTAAAAFDGWPVELSDTAGLREAAAEIEAAGIDRARAQLSDADLVIIVLDHSRAISADERALLAEFPRALTVAHKSDLPNAWSDSTSDGAEVAVSSLTGKGIEQLMKEIAARLVPAAPPSGTPIPVTERQVSCLRAARAQADSGNLDAARELVLQCASRESIA